MYRFDKKGLGHMGSELDICAAARGLACHTRLAILGWMVGEGEVGPSGVATEFELDDSVATRHLFRLSGCGLIVGEFRGNEHRYRLAKRDGATLGSRLVLAVLPVLKGCKFEDGASLVEAQEIFSACTAFTCPRRIQVLRHVRSKPGPTVETLSLDLQIPYPSVIRHLAKLIARGYLRLEKDAYVRRYYAATPAIAMQKKLQTAMLVDSSQ
jgi:DNA-binding transcriptional ArsR family regulator